ncbi:hypothetical protein CHS0354_025144 [Potamilus streckersoni]|uniref:phosphatidylinositol-3,5-bisphosphate 3-phosphatase n=1 Tax=Potamilus streckersoni TaxID=2493646 RepID=A0AAE0RWE2_9BIVA|nr:hypothetical protein CHS0354_025144 [Potamilus streckersoni]
MHENMACADQEPMSLEHVRKLELFPKKQLVTDDETLHVPFPLLSGEFPEYLGRTSDGVIVLSNFRLLIRLKKSFINIPLGLIEYLEMYDCCIYIYCKDATIIKCAFTKSETCQEWHKRLLSKLQLPKDLNELFAFAFFAWCTDRSPCPEPIQEGCYQLCQVGKPRVYNFTKEIERLGFDLKFAWRYTEINKDFSLCPSYPNEHIVPANLSDKDLKKVAEFRALHRFPTVVWRNVRNGAVLVRSSQPELGWFGWRCEEDEKFMSHISLSCSLNRGNGLSAEDSSGSESSSQDGDSAPPQNVENREPKKMLLVDCRSYSAAVANRAKGGGSECTDYYANCEVIFMNLVNIHVVRKSFTYLRQLCSSGQEQINWLSAMENTRWLLYISNILKVATQVALCLEKDGRPVLIHCSDGWDRTPQIVSLAELLLDPYYRTMEGFQVLIEREWLEFGHKFADRCGNGICTDDVNERCPVFVQWLDCVHQLIKQFPCAFEFNEAYMVKLVQHTYSCLFGTFLCNMESDRRKHNVRDHTASLWSLLCDKRFCNLLYEPNKHVVLHPSSHIRNIYLWSAVYLSKNSPFTEEEEIRPDSAATSAKSESGGTNLQKTRSCENLASLAERETSPTRRRSDPNITLEMADQGAKLLKDALQSHEDDVLKIAESLIISEQSVDNAESYELSSEDANSKLTPENLGKDKSQTENSEGVETCDCSIEIVSKLNAETEDCQTTGKFEATQTLDDKSIPNEISIQNLVCEERNSDNASGNVIYKASSESKTPSERTLMGILPCQSDSFLESSTDTVIDDLVKQVAEDDDLCKYNNRACNAHVQDETSLEGKCDKETLKEVKLVKACSVSTSTSDLADPHVILAKNYIRMHRQLKLHSVLTRAVPDNWSKSNNGFSKISGMNHSASQTPLYLTPTSPSLESTCPPTPGTSDSKSGETAIQRQLNSVGRHLDIDGLTVFSDPIQRRIKSIQFKHSQEVAVLYYQINYLQTLLSQYNPLSGEDFAFELRDDQILLADSRGNAEIQSQGNVSNASSDGSWDQVDNKDSKLTLWFPDHIVTHCAGCQRQFTLLRRKHHCRNCGKVFCYDCAKDYAPVPTQQLLYPERVCGSCYQSLSQETTKSMLESGESCERRLTETATN